MASSLARKKKVVASPRLPGPNARAVNLQGKEESLVYDGERVFVMIEPRPDTERFRKVQATNPVNGEKIWKDAPRGMMPKALIVLEEYLPLFVPEGTPGSFEDPENKGQFINPPAWREYVIDQGPHGVNQKNFWFRPDPMAIARQEAERKRQDRLNALLDRLADEDLDAGEFAMALDLAKPGKKPSKPAA